MKAFRVIIVVLITCFTLSTTVSYAQRVVRSSTPARAVVVKTPKVKTIRRLPSSSVSIRHNNITLHFAGGRYYRSVKGRYVLSMPPLGVRLRTLPSSRVSFRFNKRLYFCSAGVIYVETKDGDYEVVAPEVGMIVPELPEAGVSEVVIDERTYYEYGDLLYKTIATEDGVQYQIIGEVE